MPARTLLALVCLTAACSTVAPPAKAPAAYFLNKSGWDSNAGLGKTERSRLPPQGFLLLAGGFVSTANRAGVELRDGEDRSSIEYADAGMGQSSADASENAATRLLTAPETARLRGLAEEVSASTKSFSNENPTADFDVRLILADGDRIKDIESYGPPRDEVDRLFDATWAMIEEGRPAIELARTKLAETSGRYRAWLEKKKPFEITVSKSDETSSSGWSVSFKPRTTDRQIDCRVDLKAEKADCLEHRE